MSSRKVPRLACVAIAFVLAACTGASRRNMAGLAGGNADRGRAAAERYGCNACHAIAGMPDPSVVAAAPITGIADRAYIGGTLANTPENLVKWIRYPREIKPLTAMPDLAVSEKDARDIAVYLYSLH